MTSEELHGAPAYVVRRGGRYFAEHYRVGFLFVVDGRWMRSPKLASKYPKTIAMQIARERGGVAGELERTRDEESVPLMTWSEWCKQAHGNPLPLRALDETNLLEAEHMWKRS